MNRIESLKIIGFKKFDNFNIVFNEHLNILVGENEAGKTTILEAINIVLNQKYRNADKSILKDFFNLNSIKEFENNPSTETLPLIQIELNIIVEDKGKNSEFFFGENNLDKKEKFGILFECKFNTQLGTGLESEIANGKIPYEYYELTWKSFNGLSYSFMKKPFCFMSIDTTATNGMDTFNYYNRALFNSDDATKMRAKNDFRTRLQDVFSEIKLEEISENRQFGINDKKIPLESIISIYENGISLDNKGAGMECLILTKNFENIDSPNFSINTISSVTKNKFYVAVTRTKGNLYFIKQSIYKKIKDKNS